MSSLLHLQHFQIKHPNQYILTFLSNSSSICCQVRSLANHCMIIRFARPAKGTIVKRLMVVAQKEGMHVEPNALDFLCTSTGGDIRQILNSMQMWNSGRNGDMTYAEGK